MHALADLFLTIASGPPTPEVHDEVARRNIRTRVAASLSEQLLPSSHSLPFTKNVPDPAVTCGDAGIVLDHLLRRAKLSPREWAVVDALRRYGFDHGDRTRVARELGIQPATARRLWLRARRKLRAAGEEDSQAA
jgi:hypothetical protein